MANPKKSGALGEWAAEREPCSRPPGLQQPRTPNGGSMSAQTHRRLSTCRTNFTGTYLREFTDSFLNGWGGTVWNRASVEMEHLVPEMAGPKRQGDTGGGTVFDGT